MRRIAPLRLDFVNVLGTREQFLPVSAVFHGVRDALVTEPFLSFERPRPKAAQVIADCVPNQLRPVSAVAGGLGVGFGEKFVFQHDLNRTHTVDCSPMLSTLEARRIALAAQGFGKPRPARVTAAHLDATVRRIAPLQLDFVNVLMPAHYLIPFSRLGPYSRPALHSLLYEHGGFTEQWAHEAAVIPVETWPLLKHRMAEHSLRPRGFETVLKEHRAYAEAVISAITERGPLAASALPEPPEAVAAFRGTWIGTFQRAVLEAFFGQGRLASANRSPNFVRSYDLAERRIPVAHHGHAPSRAEAVRALLLKAAGAHGVGTAHDLADYYRLSLSEARAGLEELVRQRQLELVSVEGWREAGYLHPLAARPRSVRACSLLSPFDPLVWFRPRTKRLFGFDYTIEIYTPAAKRKFGYYVLPFLQGERLTGRVDLKADRGAGTLRVLAAYHEAGEDPDFVAGPLLAELDTLRRWLGLARMEVEDKGNLATELMRR